MLFIVCGVLLLVDGTMDINNAMMTIVYSFKAIGMLVSGKSFMYVSLIWYCVVVVLYECH